MTMIRRSSSHTVLRAVLVRLLYGIPVLFIVTLGASALANFVPGSPGQAILGSNSTPQAVAALNKRYGYDQPFLERYWHWVWAALHGNLGSTVFSNEHVSTLLINRLGVTGELTLLALLMALVVSVPLALIAAGRPNGIVSRIAQVTSSVLLSVPSFVAVVVLSLIFTAQLGIFPPTGWVTPGQSLPQNLHYALLPAFSLATYEGAFFYRVLRAELITTLREDFVMVARAKGLPRRYILVRHVLRPATGALVTVFGLSLGRLLGGAVIAETFFAVPGLGAEAVNAVAVKDFGVLQGIVALAVIIYVLVFILVDLAYAWIDPRISVR
jgi:peptide/nickel transport system permease protein